ncbi:MAG: peptidase domain-containing ABC transporter [Bacteroidales bacterium]|nr:peptidase domain-containing ABC transporter [Bacteroidales bacterium]
MSRLEIKRIRKSFVKQLDQSDCGVACLSSIIRYFGGMANMENLRETSGTSKQGTTLLGLYKAAEKHGFIPEGLEGDINSLKEIHELSILHINTDNQQLHYIVCYGFDGKCFIIGDPAKKVYKCLPEKLEELWESRCLLLLTPDRSFKQSLPGSNPKRRWFIDLLTGDFPILSIIGVLGLVISFLGLALTVFTQQLIDKILPAADKPKLISGIALVSLLLLVRGFITFVRGNLSNIQNRDFNNRLIAGFYGSLLYLSKSFFNNRKTGELVARMEDTARIQMAIAYVFNDVFNEAILVIISLCLVFYYSVTVGIVMVSIIPIYFLVAFLLDIKIRNDQYAVMAANARKTGNYINTIQGIDAIKVNNREMQFSLLNKKIYGAFQDKLFALGNLGITIQLFMDIISIGLIIVIVTVSSLMILDQRLTIGELTAIISISASILPAVSSIAFFNIRLNGAKVAFDRMYEFTGITREHNHEVKIDIAENLSFQELSVNHIYFGFPGRKLIIKDYSLIIRKSEITVLLGESGCGKTTFLNVLQKLYLPERGTIHFNGIPLANIETSQWRNIIGVVPQEICLFNGTLLDNIGLAASQEDYQNIYSFCIGYGFDPYFKNFPYSYATMLGEEGINLSGGQKQLIAMARALYRKPKLLLLDEPTSAMDKNTENFVIHLIQSLREEIGILIITHRNHLARLGDRIYVMENGSVALRG